MQTTYAQKNETTQRAADNTAAAVHDNSPQSECLQRKADLTNAYDVVAQRKSECSRSADIPTLQKRNEGCTCENVAQMKTVDALIEDYYGLYGNEIDQTDTFGSLMCLELAGGKLKFTDTLDECEVHPYKPNEYAGALEQKDRDINKYVEFVCIPGLNFKMGNICEDKDGTYRNFGEKAKNDGVDIRRIYALHELEHLRIINKNITEGKASKFHLGEPQLDLPLYRNDVRKEKIREIENAIPPNGKEGVKASYIRKRLEYAKSFSEYPTVLLELIKLCEIDSELQTDRWKPFSDKLKECYRPIQ